jgi:DNA polymerase-3 subunit gamma/tau
MSKQALYRKYRPRTFEEIRGQDHIVSSLKESIRSGEYPHAFLFYGSRGLGKTTLARLVSAELGVLPEDIYEIDGASNRKIEHVRELRASFATYPLSSKYKVYIIDEVHMLTREAFNALLKSIEEPPAHVIFMFATTEIEKIPETIVSRCQVLRLRKPTLEVLKGLASDVAKSEGYSLSEEVAEMIAIAGDGSFRDTLGSLQAVLSGTEGKKIDIDSVGKITRVPKKSTVFDIIEAIMEEDIEKALESLSASEENHIDPKILGAMLVEMVRMVLKIRFDKKSHTDLQERMSSDEWERYIKIASIEGKVVNANVLQEALQTLPMARTSGYGALELFIHKTIT